MEAKRSREATSDAIKDWNEIFQLIHDAVFVAKRKKTSFLYTS